MPDPKDETNPVQTAGTIGGRGATIRPRKDEDEQASPGAAADQKQLAHRDED
ncbi:MAG TPA: hypothetical protein VGC86_13810 [Afipia sp.]